MANIDLSGEQIRAIQDWARGASPYVTEVRLFGSRARGEARAGSDVDLAVVVPHYGSYAALADKWQAELRRTVVLPVNSTTIFETEKSWTNGAPSPVSSFSLSAR